MQILAGENSSGATTERWIEISASNKEDDDSEKPRNREGRFENEALENEDRSTKHPRLENEVGASFSRFGCFVLRASFSSASFSKLPQEGEHRFSLAQRRRSRQQETGKTRERLLRVEYVCRQLLWRYFFAASVFNSIQLFLNVEGQNTAITMRTKPRKRGNCGRFEKVPPIRNGFATKAIRRGSAFLEVCCRNSAYFLRCNDRQQELHDLWKTRERDRYLSNGLSWEQPISHCTMSKNGFIVIGDQLYMNSLEYNQCIMCDMCIVGKRKICQQTSPT